MLCFCWHLRCQDSAAISFEVVWARLLAMVMGSSVYAFGTLIVVLLIGLGAGSAIYGRTPRTRETHRRTFGILEGFIALAAALSLITLPHIPAWFLRYFPAFREAFDCKSLRTSRWLRWSRWYRRFYSAPHFQQ